MKSERKGRGEVGKRWGEVKCEVKGLGEVEEGEGGGSVRGKGRGWGSGKKCEIRWENRLGELRWGR